MTETTALGAAMAAGNAKASMFGVWIRWSSPATHSLRLFLNQVHLELSSF